MNNTKKAAVNPLKKSPMLGASLVFLGIDKSMPIHHGSQGCTAFTKTFLTQHFREIVPMQNTALTDIATIMGKDTNLIEGLDTVIKKQSPDMVGVVTTGLSETRGDDIKNQVERFRELHPEHAGVEIIYVNTPDYDGDAYTGFSAAVEAVIKQSDLEKMPVKKGRINVLAGMMLTAGDIDEIRDVMVSFGLEPFFLPDLSGSLSGSVGYYYGTAVEASEVEKIKSLGEAEYTIAIGTGAENAAELLYEKTGVPYKTFESLTGVSEADKFISFLMEISGRDVEARIKKQRKIAVDTMLDGHFYYGGKQCVIAVEPDSALAYSRFVRDELGISVSKIITTANSEKLADDNICRIIIGDLEDAELAARDADFIISNTNAKHAADRLNIGLIRAGIPVKDRVGQFNRVTVLYRGCAYLAAEIANLLLEQDEHKSWTEQTDNMRSKL